MAPPTPVVRFGRRPARVPVQLGSSPARTGTGVRVVDTGQILEFKWDSGSSETEPEPEPASCSPSLRFHISAVRKTVVCRARETSSNPGIYRL